MDFLLYLHILHKNTDAKEDCSFCIRISSPFIVLPDLNILFFKINE